ncbi:hypothetical protein AHAS_Ahas04G0211100 [Arachis hypogaea]
MAANLGVVTGKHLAEHCRNEYPWATNFILWFIAEIAIVACNIPEVIGTAFALSMLFNIPVWIGVLLTGLSTLILLALQQYGVRKLEFLIAFLVFTIAACFFAELGYAKPIAKEVLKGLFVPELKGSGATDYPVYHSLYDDFIWMQKFGDPMFHRHVAGSMSFHTLGERIGKGTIETTRETLNVKNLEDEISNKDMNLSPILKSIKELEKAAIKINDQRKEIEASKGWRTWKKYQMKVRDMNDRLMMAERAFTDRDGLLGMTWHKHLEEIVTELRIQHGTKQICFMAVMFTSSVDDAMMEISAAVLSPSGINYEGGSYCSYVGEETEVRAEEAVIIKNSSRARNSSWSVSQDGRPGLMKLGVKGRHRGNTLGEIAGEKAGIFKLLRCLSLTKQCLKRRLNGLRLGLEDLPLLSNLNLNRCNITDDGCEKFSRSSSGHHQHQHQHHHHQVVEEVSVQRVKKEEVLAANHGEKEGSEGIPTLDFRGYLIDKSKTGGWLAAGLILGIELAERMCYENIYELGDILGWNFESFIS